jgi:hypothetical protein
MAARAWDLTISRQEEHGAWKHSRSGEGGGPRGASRSSSPEAGRTEHLCGALLAEQLDIQVCPRPPTAAERRSIDGDGIQAQQQSAERGAGSGLAVAHTPEQKRAEPTMIEASRGSEGAAYFKIRRSAPAGSGDDDDDDDD